MRRESGAGTTFNDPTTVLYSRCTVDLGRKIASFDEVRCQNLEDLLGGFGRSFQFLATRNVTDAFSDDTTPAS